MTIQLLVTAAIVGLAAVYLLRSTWRTWVGKKSGCSSGCGKCATAETAAAPEQKGRIPLPQL